MLSTLLALVPVVLPQDPAPADGGARDQAAQTRRPMPIPRTLVMQRGARNIEIDGSLQDWPALPPVGLDDARQLSGTAWGAWRGPDDLAARLFLMWDPEHLWIGAAVLDDWHVRLREDTPRMFEIPPADALSITFDPRRDTLAAGSDPHRADDVTFWIADVDGQGERIVRWDRFRGVARLAPSSAGRVRRDAEERVTFYEARIAWADALPEGVAPAPRAVFDAQFVVDDYDEPTDLLAQTRVGWNFGMGPRIDPGLFGSMMLADVTAEDIGGGGFALPDFPAPPEPEVPAALTEAHWIALLETLRANGPVASARDSVDHASLGGATRRDALLRLESATADHPRVDYLELLSRVQRRMNRECEGIVAGGVPYFWDQLVQELSRTLKTDPPTQGVACHRLPMGGWLLRSAAATLVVDPAGYRMERVLGDVVDVVLLTRAGDPSRRHDPLLARARERDIPVLMHLAVHQPAVAMADLQLVSPGDERTPRGLLIRVLGEKSEDGAVSSGVGYHVRFPDGTDVVVSSTSADEARLDVEDGVELLILSPFHPRAQVVGQRIGAGLTVVDDLFRCSVVPGPAGRATLEQGWQLQADLRPQRAMILAPGESVTVAPR